MRRTLLWHCEFAKLAGAQAAEIQAGNHNLGAHECRSEVIEEIKQLPREGAAEGGRLNLIHEAEIMQQIGTAPEVSEEAFCASPTKWFTRRERNRDSAKNFRFASSPNEFGRAEILERLAKNVYDICMMKSFWRVWRLGGNGTRAWGWLNRRWVRHKMPFGMVRWRSMF
jgi:hypothetical protein